MIKLYDSKTKSIHQLNDKKVTIYNCGPTVYNDLHIGNIRPIITFDVLVKLLKANKYNVTMLSNITDIDDKIIAKAIKEKTSEQKISEKYIRSYEKLLSSLGISKFEKPKITSEIKTIISYIKKLINKKAAYVVDGNVYFDVRKSPSYGKLSNKKIDELLDGVRINNNENKKSPLDFVLWKKTSTGLRWNSPWSKGRPGWHTECFALINKKIGKQVTIHGGGVDLKFPHHENENAQNIALNKKDLAKIWMHIGHVNINNEKMSKSLNNFVLAKDLLIDYSVNDIKWFFYQTKYENPINFSRERIVDAHLELKKIIKTISYAKTMLACDNKNIIKKTFDKKFVEILSNDLDLPNSIKRIWDLVKIINDSIRNKKYSYALTNLSNLLFNLDILGINFPNIHNKKNLELVKKWFSFLTNKNFKEADNYRKILVDKGLL